MLVVAVSRAAVYSQGRPCVGYLNPASFSANSARIEGEFRPNAARMQPNSPFSTLFSGALLGRLSLLCVECASEKNHSSFLRCFGPLFRPLSGPPFLVTPLSLPILFPFPSLSSSLSSLSVPLPFFFSFSPFRCLPFPFRCVPFPLPSLPFSLPSLSVAYPSLSSSLSSLSVAFPFFPFPFRSLPFPVCVCFAHRCFTNSTRFRSVPCFGPLRP